MTDESSGDMGPAIDQLPRPLITHDLGQRFVGLVDVAFQEAAAVSGQELQRMLPSPAGGIVEQHDGRSGTAMASIVGQDGPELAGLRCHPTGVQNRCAGLVHEDPVGGAEMGLQVVDHGHQLEAGAADPVAECAAVAVETSPLEDPRLAVERKEVFELRDDSPREQATATGAAYSAVTFFPVTQMGRIEPYVVELSFPAWPAMMVAIRPRTPLCFAERHARSHAPSQVIRPSARLNRQYRQLQCHTAEVIARGGEVRAVCQEQYAEDSGTLR